MSWMIACAPALLGFNAPLTSAGTATEPDRSEPVAEDTPKDIVVVGRGERRVGSDRAASAGAIAGEDIRSWPLLRTNELAEAVPGLLAVQHSGGGKAAQYYVRGYNLDHGTDFSISLDGVPMNLP